MFDTHQKRRELAALHTLARQSAALAVSASRADCACALFAPRRHIGLHQPQSACPEPLEGQCSLRDCLVPNQEPPMNMLSSEEIGPRNTRNARTIKCLNTEYHFACFAGNTNQISTLSGCAQPANWLGLKEVLHEFHVLGPIGLLGLNAMQRMVFLLITGLSFTALVANRLVVAPQPGGNDQPAILLAIDDHLLPFKKNLCFYLSKPKVRQQPVLTPSRDNPRAPDYLGTHFYGTVLHDEGEFRMWYYAISHKEQPSELRIGPVCYATSENGIDWVKPNLGQVEYKGSKDNNAIDLPGSETWAVGVVKDESDPDPQRRYKMVYNLRGTGLCTIRSATSPDGIRWQPGADGQLDSWVEQSSFYRHDSLFIVHGQGREDDAGEGGFGRGRQGFAWVSSDLDNWVGGYAEAFVLPEPATAGERGYLMPYEQVHLGVGAASFGNVAVGLYGKWFNPPVQQRSTGWYGFGQIYCDFGLVISNDGIHFREPVRGHVFLSHRDSPAPAIKGQSYPTILTQANGILNVGDETRIYHGRWRNAPYGNDYYVEVGLATLPRDRWGALGLYPDRSEGWVWSAPIKLPRKGCRAFINADHAQLITMEIADEWFNLMDEYSGENAGRTAGPGGLSCPVTWPDRDLKDLGGQTIRLRIHIEKHLEKSPRLFAVYLGNPTASTAGGPCATAVMSNAEILPQAGGGSNVEAKIKQLRDQLNTDPLNAELHCRLAELLERQGHLEQAIEAYREALRINPTFQKVQARLSALE